MGKLVYDDTGGMKVTPEIWDRKVKVVMDIVDFNPEQITKYLNANELREIANFLDSL